MGDRWTQCLVQWWVICKKKGEVWTHNSENDGLLCFLVPRGASKETFQIVLFKGWWFTHLEVMMAPRGLLVTSQSPSSWQLWSLTEESPMKRLYPGSVLIQDKKKSRGIWNETHWKKQKLPFQVKPDSPISFRLKNVRRLCHNTLTPKKHKE